jgi:hypothetical protein
VRSALDDVLSRVSEVRVLRWTSSSPSYRRHSPTSAPRRRVKRASQKQPPAGAHSASRRCRVHSQPLPRTRNIRPPLVAPRPRPARLDTQQGHPTCSGGSCSVGRTRDRKGAGLVVAVTSAASWRRHQPRRANSSPLSRSRRQHSRGRHRPSADTDTHTRPAWSRLRVQRGRQGTTVLTGSDEGGLEPP